MSRTARRTAALLSPERLTWQGRAGRAIAPARFGGVGAWRVRGNSAVFLRSRERGIEDAVVFPGISSDGYFGYRASTPALHFQPHPWDISG